MAFKWLTTCVAVRRKRGWFFRNTSFSVSIQFWFCQYSNITWALWHLKSPVTRMFVQQFVSIKKTPMCHIIVGDPSLRGPVMREAFPCRGVIMQWLFCLKTERHLTQHTLRKSFGWWHDLRGARSSSYLDRPWVQAPPSMSSRQTIAFWWH